MRAILKWIFVTLPADLADGTVWFRRLTEPVALAALILLGVHGAADLLDDVLFAAVDHSDRVFDAGLRSLLDGLAGAGILAVETAAEWADAAALWLDIDRKEGLAVALALVAELLLGLALLLWCVAQPSVVAGDAASATDTSVGFKQRLLQFVRQLRRFTPGSLRGLTVVLAFFMGAFTLGRWSAGRSALWLTGPIFGEGTADLARLIGVLIGGAALLTLVPLALRRAQARAQSMSRARWLRAYVMPGLAAALMVGAVITGGPGQALARLIGGAE